MISDHLVQKMRSTPNRGVTHIFMGHPLSDGCDKTTVEPGNTYSPGVWTCGISLWFESVPSPPGRGSSPQASRGGVPGITTPDLLPDDAIEWTLDPPVVTARYSIGPAVVTHRLTHLGDEGSEGVDFNDVRIVPTESAATDITAHIVVKDIGPAGGKIESLDWDAAGRVLTVNSSIVVQPEFHVVECTVVEADEECDSPMAILSLSIGAATAFSFRTAHNGLNRSFSSAIPRADLHGDLSVSDGFTRAVTEWKDGLRAGVFCPDARVGRMWEQCAHHVLAAMECGLPRIGAVNYPVFWIRDGVIVLRALDLLGRHDLSRIGNEYLAPVYFSGGFGAESDAPGQGIWQLVSHGLITDDPEWLERVFPFIQARIDYLDRMLTTEKPVRAMAESRVPRMINSPGINILCLSSQNGLIHGRMDWHSPDFYINCWAAAGFDYASQAAARIGRNDVALDWSNRASDLEGRIAKWLLPQYGNERDPIVAPYPTGVFGGRCEVLTSAFGNWFSEHRLDAHGQRKPEPLWTYFEVAQIHNAMLLGLKDEAWTCLDGMLEPDATWNVAAFIEGGPGAGEMLPFCNAVESRGWLQTGQARGGNMPHNWTTAEMINLIRDLFVCERDGKIVLGQGVPDAWLTPGGRFGVQNMPTSLGSVSYEVTIGENGVEELIYEGPRDYSPCWK